MMAIKRYIQVHYNCKLSKQQSSNCYNVFDDGILLIIRDYCKPLLLTVINAMAYSEYTYWHFDTQDVKELNMKELTANHQRYADKLLKCVVIGPRAMGKTCLLISYTNNEFPGEYIPTLFDSYSMPVSFDGDFWYLGFSDTAPGYEDSRRWRQMMYAMADIFMLCMSVHDTTQYQMDPTKTWSDQAVNVLAIRQEAQKLHPTVPCVLVGTKIDLRNEKDTKADCYTTEEMRSFAELWECNGYAECSALTQIGLEEATDTVLEHAVKHRRVLVRQLQKKKSCILL